MIQLTLTHTTDESPTIRTFHFQPERPLDYQAGQFIELYLPHPKPDSKGQLRQFTLSSSPTEHGVAITVKGSADSTSSSFKQALWQLKPHDTIGASDPLGDFVLPLDPSVPLVWIAGGIGITPFRSLATWLADSKEERQVLLLHSTSHPHERIFADHIRRAGIKLYHIDTANQERLQATAVLDHVRKATSSSPAQPGFGGSNPSTPAKNNFSIDDALLYVSGPERMVNDLVRDLQKNGIARERIVSDAFLGYPN